MTQWRPRLEYYTESSLNQRLAVFSHVALFTAIPRLDYLKELVTLAVASGIDEKDIQEILLQSYLFLGFPRAINALSAVESIWKVPVQEFEADLKKSEMEKRGKQLCEQIYGSNYEKLLQKMEQIHPDLKRYMIEEGYGKILSRGKLTPVEREFGILPILLVTNVLKQLHSHLVGTLYLGAKRNDLLALFQHLVGPLTTDQVTPAIQLLEKI